MEIQNTNLSWIARGNTGCVFATLFAKNPECVGWRFIPFWQYMPIRVEDDLIVSITFPESWTKDKVKWWALSPDHGGMFEEKTSDDTIGLRIQCPEGVSWVQYFGPDSHVKTRQAPFPMLMFTRKLNTSYYIKVGFKGILHLAHAWCKEIKEGMYDTMWNRSHKQTEKLLGHKPTIKEAAKSTFYESKVNT